MGEHIELTAADGFTLQAYRAEPEGAPRGGIVVVQEIFGVNQHIREVTDGYAAQGYVAIAPAIFDRAEPGFEVGYDDDGRQAGITIAMGADRQLFVADVAAAVAEAAAAGSVGVVGYCLGGTVAYASAVHVDGVAAAVGYYGGQVYDMREMAPKCPTMLHFGSQDAGIPMEKVEAVVADRPEVEVHVYDADHGFNCDHRSSYSADASAAALERTLAFFAEHVG